MIPITLFDLPLALPAPATLPYARGRATSREAAILAAPNAGTDRARVLDLLRQRGPMTLEQIEDDLSLSGNTVRPRRLELEKAGLVRDSGRTARTARGRSAVLWEAVLPSSFVGEGATCA